MEAYFFKLGNAFYPHTEHDKELLDKVKQGETVKLRYVRPRNYEFLKKYMALLNLAFDYWNPPDAPQPSWLKGAPEKNFDRFRKDIAILAGFHETTVRLNGDIRVEAQSIAFDKMTEDEFECLYMKTIDIIIKKVLRDYDADSMREIISMIEAFE